MTTFSVALLQLLPGRSLEETLQKGLACCRQAKALGADLALFPEMWSTGYATFSPEAAIPPEGPFINAFQDLARELHMAIAVTYLERFQPLPRNALMVIDRFGRPVLRYAKVHTCDFGAERALTPGEDFYVADLDTPGGPVKIGAMICYDREFPESARILMLKGAEILLVPNACPMELNRLAQLRTRAFENMVGIATANYPAGQPDCNGHSSAFDGIAYGEVSPGVTLARDTLVVEAGEGEGIFLAPFPMDQLRAYRQQEVHGNAYRRPRLYHPLTAQDVAPPFHREDARR